MAGLSDREREWNREVKHARIKDPETDRLLGYYYKGRMFEGVNAMRDFFDDEWAEIQRQADGIEQDFRRTFTYADVDIYRTRNGVKYRKATGKCECHSMAVDFCPLVLERDLKHANKKHRDSAVIQEAADTIKNLKKTNDAKTERIHQLEWDLRIARDKKPETVYEIKTEYRDYVADIENDPQFQISAIDATYRGMQAENANRKKIAAFLLLSGAAALTISVIVSALAILIVAGGCTAAGMIAIGGMNRTQVLIENRIERAKWDRRNQLALEAQMQTYLNDSTTGSTLPMTSGKPHSTKEQWRVEEIEA